jgi:ribonuclease Z
MASFPSPLCQSTRSDVLEWQFPKPYSAYVLTGKSRAAWHTSFVIPQLNLLLDAGLCVNKFRPKHIFLTHGHSDHTLLSAAFVNRHHPPDIFCPAEMRQVFDDFILANTFLNLGGLVGPDDPVDASQVSEGEGQSDDENPAEGVGWLNTHVTHGMKPGDVVPLRRLKNSIFAEAFACDHTVPCLGYVFKTLSQRLRPEYQSLDGQELRQLREAGVEITSPHCTPFLAFLGDTTTEPFLKEPQWLKDGIPVVITECSFLYPEHTEQGRRTKHTVWADLEKVVRRWPKTTFVLMHFSLRYSDEEIRRFFKDMEHPPSNILVWVDGLDSEGES